MNTSIGAPQRRIHRGRVIASVLAVAWMLAGCSAASNFEPAGPGADMASAGGYEGAPDSGEMTEESGSAHLEESNRSVIVTGSLYMTVEDPVAIADKARAVVQDAGGRIDGRSETAPDDYSGGSAWLVMRIPTASLDMVVGELRKLGTVDEYRTDSYDVTTEVTDLEAQISTLRASTARIESLLDQASDISDIIKLETELAERQARLESLEARQRGLDDQVSMSTIELSLTTEPIVEVEDDPRSFWDGLVAGWDGLVTFVSGALVVFGMLLPWLVVLAVITFGIILIVRSASQRRRNRKAQAHHDAVKQHAAHVQQAPPAQPSPPADSTPPAPSSGS